MVISKKQVTVDVNDYDKKKSFELIEEVFKSIVSFGSSVVLDLNR